MKGSDQWQKDGVLLQQACLVTRTITLMANVTHSVYAHYIICRNSTQYRVVDFYGWLAF